MHTNFGWLKVFDEHSRNGDIFLKALTHSQVPKLKLKMDSCKAATDDMGGEPTDEKLDWKNWEE